ncbi:hypothetical protein SBRY_70032 [Actinacidiphila bryophytorum]|uniref:Uncharacterized protein n=1 Tax=Actinacidiphila bryophytorum TaxID=1436133 RepID=A0A9W4H6X6_9ACTN|nr:hypothetical protein SBRY_70032 [Actinacidiphila bryophytorum]
MSFERRARSPVRFHSSRAISSAGEHFVHTEGVTGSIPVSPTSTRRGRSATARTGPAYFLASGSVRLGGVFHRLGGGLRGESFRLGTIQRCGERSPHGPVRPQSGADRCQTSV